MFPALDKKKRTKVLNQQIRGVCQVTVCRGHCVSREEKKAPKKLLDHRKRQGPFFLGRPPPPPPYPPPEPPPKRKVLCPGYFYSALKRASSLLCNKHRPRGGKLTQDHLFRGPEDSCMLFKISFAFTIFSWAINLSLSGTE